MRPVKRGVGKKIPKGAKRAPRPVENFDAKDFLEPRHDDLDRLYEAFEINDTEDIQGILNGSVGVGDYE